MAYENSAGLGVHNHYGPRAAEGVKGFEPTKGVERKYVVFYDSDVDLDDQVQIPVGSLVTGVTGPANVTAVTVGGTAVKAATEVAPVAITTAGVPILTGAADGDIVIIKYLHVAGTLSVA